MSTRKTINNSTEHRGSTGNISLLSTRYKIPEDIKRGTVQFEEQRKRDTRIRTGNGALPREIDNRRRSLMAIKNRLRRKSSPEKNGFIDSEARRRAVYNRRVSLHGKVRYARPSTTEKKIILQRYQTVVYNFLERPSLKKEKWRSFSVYYQVVSFVLVFSCLVLTMFTKTDHIGDETLSDESFLEISIEDILIGLERIIMIQFTVEYILRLWSAGCRSRYQGLIGRFHFAKRPFCLIDLVVVIASWILFFGEFTIERGLFAASALRAFRFLQIVRMVRVDRRGGTWKLLGSVVYAHSKELLTAMYIAFLLLIFASYIIWQVEFNTPICQLVKNGSYNEEIHEECHFLTFGDSLWWGFITLTTIGYGDKVPTTSIGKTIAAFFAVLGMAFFALPAGILGTGFALKVQEQHRQKHFARRRNPAAYLIQCVWRTYAADEESSSVATWECALTAINGNKKTGVTGLLLRRIYSQNSEEEHIKDDGKRPSRLWSDRLALFKRDKNDIDEDDAVCNDDDNTECQDLISAENMVGELSEVQRCALRFIRMLKFLVARRKFKEALRPYDVKDVIEQYSAGHVDMLARIKLLQNRVENILGVSGKTESISGATTTPNFINHASMNGRIISLEKKLTNLDHKLDILLSRIPSPTEKKTSYGALRYTLKPPDSDREQKAAFIIPPKSGDTQPSTRKTSDTRETKEADF